MDDDVECNLHNVGVKTGKQVPEDWASIMKRTKDKIDDCKNSIVEIVVIR